jgi:branched-chain amino acid aminotransferase
MHITNNKEVIYINGNFFPENDAKINCNDRGFLLSDGLFETLRIYAGLPHYLQEHWERLQNGANFLKIPLPIDITELKLIISTLLQYNNLSTSAASIRLTLSRGTGPRGLAPPAVISPTLVLSATPLLPIRKITANVFITSIPRNELSPLSQIKSLNYLDNMLAHCEALENNADEGVLLNTQGNIAEASTSNIFIVTKDGIITPRLQDGALPGVTRKIVIALCKENQLPLLETSITVSQLLQAREIFLTNSIIEIKPVIKVNQHIISNGTIGKITALVQANFQKKLFSSTNQKDD